MCNESDLEQDYMQMCSTYAAGKNSIISNLSWHLRAEKSSLNMSRIKMLLIHRPASIFSTVYT